jgi:hypothetical protein
MRRSCEANPKNKEIECDACGKRAKNATGTSLADHKRKTCMLREMENLIEEDSGEV